MAKGYTRPIAPDKTAASRATKALPLVPGTGNGVEPRRVGLTSRVISDLVLYKKMND
jgi:hypothetical protein